MAHDRFDYFIDVILDQEGGEYTNHPNDKGGPTKWGITLNFYQTHVDSDATKETIKNLRRSKAVKIYKDTFWNPANFAVEDYNMADLPVPIGEVTMSYSINMGWKNAHELLQETLNEVGPDVSIDGWLGPKTINAAHEIEETKLLNNFSIQAAARYSRIIINDHSQEVFLEGWMRRVIDNYETGVKLIIKEKLDI